MCVCVCKHISAWFCKSAIPSIKRSKCFRSCYPRMKMKCLPMLSLELTIDYSTIPALPSTFTHTHTLFSLSLGLNFFFQSAFAVNGAVVLAGVAFSSLFFYGSLFFPFHIVERRIKWLHAHKITPNVLLLHEYVIRKYITETCIYTWQVCVILCVFAAVAGDTSDGVRVPRIVDIAVVVLPHFSYSQASYMCVE